MDHDQPMPLAIAGCSGISNANKRPLTETGQPEVQPEPSTSPDLHLDPAIYASPAFRCILRQFRDNLSQLIKLRVLSTKWEAEVIDELRSQLTLKLFHSEAALAYYPQILSQYGLQNDAFYKVAEADADELIGQIGPTLFVEPKPSAYLADVMGNVKHLVIDASTVELELLLTKWIPSLESLVILKWDHDKIETGDLTWCPAVAQMASLTRLELYDIYLENIEIYQMGEVFSRLEHFVLGDFLFDYTKNGSNHGDCYAMALMPVLAALKPGTLKYLGIVINRRNQIGWNGFDVHNLKLLFKDWNRGRVLVEGLKGLNLGSIKLDMLEVVVEVAKGLESLNIQPVGDASTLDTLLKTLAPLRSLTDLRLTFPDSLNVLELKPSHRRVVLPSITRFDLSCTGGSYLLEFDFLPALLRSAFPNLTETHLSDCHWNDANPQCARFRDQLDDGLEKKAHIYWARDYHEYFPKRLWERFPAMCREACCVGQPHHREMHHTGFTGCPIEIDRQEREKNDSYKSK